MLSPIFIRVSEIWRQWDLLVSRNILYTLKSIGWDVDPISPATKDYIAVKSPTFLISNLLFYIVIIGFGRARIRRTQRKQDLQNGSPGWVHFFVIIHNIFLILLSLYMCCGCILEARKNKYHLWGNEYKQSEVEMAKYIYIFYNNLPQLCLLPACVLSHCGPPLRLECAVLPKESGQTGNRQ